MNSTIEGYLKQIKKIIPTYEGPKRGRGQCTFLSSLTGEEKEKFIFLENKIKLEKNRIAAKMVRKRKKHELEFLTEENDDLKIKIKSFKKDNFKLSEEVSVLKKQNLNLQDELFSLREKNYKLEKRLSLVNNLEVETNVPVVPEWENITDFVDFDII